MVSNLYDLVVLEIKFSSHSKSICHRLSFLGSSFVYLKVFLLESKNPLTKNVCAYKYMYMYLTWDLEIKLFFFWHSLQHCRLLWEQRAMSWKKSLSTQLQGNTSIVISKFHLLYTGKWSTTFTVTCTYFFSCLMHFLKNTDWTPWQGCTLVWNIWTVYHAS